MVLSTLEEYPDVSNPKSLRDKFRVQSVAIDSNTTIEELGALWKRLESSHKPKEGVILYQEDKIKVKLVVPASQRALVASEKGEKEAMELTVGPFFFFFWFFFLLFLLFYSPPPPVCTYLSLSPSPSLYIYLPLSLYISLSFSVEYSHTTAHSYFNPLSLVSFSQQQHQVMSEEESDHNENLHSEELDQSAYDYDDVEPEESDTYEKVG